MDYQFSATRFTYVNMNLCTAESAGYMNIVCENINSEPCIFYNIASSWLAKKKCRDVYCPTLYESVRNSRLKII